jgi:quercetin dioxygenase-like cupin family protein
MAMLVTGAQTNGASATLEATIAPGVGPPAHLHTREDETIVVTRGRFRFWHGRHVVDGEPGTVVYLPRYEAHQLLNVGRTSGSLIITIVPAGLERMFMTISQRGLTISKDQAELLTLCSQYGIISAPAVAREAIKTSVLK